MKQVNTWQRILLFVLLFGMFAGESQSFAASFSLWSSEGSEIHGEMNVSVNPMLAANNYSQKPLKYATTPEMFKIVDINKAKAFRMAEREITSSKSVTALAKPGAESKPPSGKAAAIPVSAPREDQIIRSVKVVATGYTAGYESTGKRPNHPQYGITFSGVKVRRDKNTVSTIAADPKLFPLGTILYIPGYGYGVVADTGSAIKGKKIDLYFATTKQVYKEWGKKEVEVFVIKHGNGKCSEEMITALGKAIQTYKTIPASLLKEAI